VQVLQVQLEIRPDPAEVGRARRWARSRLAVSGIGADEPLAETLILLVSELVTNAVRHAGLKAGDRIGLLVDRRDTVLRVEVDDPGTGFDLRPPRPDPARASGWGLYLVDELADRWGMDRGGRGGTRIWFELDEAWS
jgi:anti-sigma regulatory factor (Ser/Thr protein kinase)